MGANVIKLSWWGHNREYETSAPTLNTIEVNKRTFEEAGKRSILVAPLLEVSPAFPLWYEYPENTSNLEARIKEVLSKYGQYPNWLSLYDKFGVPRRAIFLIENIHVGPVDRDKFARTFDIVAEKIKTETGYNIGFVIDPTPLPPYSFSQYDGPVPEALKNTQSLLGINPFNITTDGNTDQERLEWAEKIAKPWEEAGFPFMFPAIPGFDDHLVRPPGTIYGFTPQWSEQMENLAKKYQIAGITLDIWNGFTEGYVFVPTVERGYEDYNLAKRLFSYLISLQKSRLPQRNVCLQVVTAAKDPITGRCQEFATPCDVPIGWDKVTSCGTGLER